MTCPKCQRVQHHICGDRNCACYKHIPAGELAQIDRPMIRGVIVPRRLFNWLWRYLPYQWRRNMYELIECPYCGFRQTHDYWFEREIEAAEREGVLP